jgi:NAD(P)-dependent dehydrogenase (short-subunit alcohol dehydrogenase family)
MTEEVWNKTIDVNLKGYVFVSKEVVGFMKQNKIKGSVVNISSIAGAIGFAGLSAYCSSKHAIVGLTKTMALDLAADNIRVNGIGPGVIETAMTKSFLENEQWKQFFLMKIPLKRVGQPVEIAKMALFLASDAASYMTGTTVFIDGGWLTG